MCDIKDVIMRDISQTGAGAKPASSPARDQPLALSGIFEQGNFPCYAATTVQPGKAMTVK
jgi:hypothetical protein